MFFNGWAWAQWCICDPCGWNVMMLLNFCMLDKRLISPIWVWLMACHMLSISCTKIQNWPCKIYFKPIVLNHPILWNWNMFQCMGVRGGHTHFGMDHVEEWRRDAREEGTTARPYSGIMHKGKKRKGREKGRQKRQERKRGGGGKE